VKLKKQTIIYICPTVPFNFQGTFFKPSHFSSKLVQYDKGKLYQGIRVGDKVFGLVISDSSEPKKPRIKIDVYAASSIQNEIKEEITSELIARYDLKSEISEFIKKFKSDDLLAGSIKRWKGMRPSTAYSLYDFLMVTIVLQNATVARSIQMMDNLLKKFGKKLIFAGKEIFIIWKPKDMQGVSEEELRELKVGYRSKTIKRISESFTFGEIDEKKLRLMANKDDIKKDLLELYGVGPQSVSYILFEAFHFYDALDHLSPWEQKIYSRLIFGKKTVLAERIVKTSRKRWGKWCMLAMHYLFEDLFWRRQKEKIPWLEEEIRT
jgi:3-methyladenine DNA glycosylase/8-oxoguanine DNA glycosylase